ncbi:hypothetical protein M3Y98_00837100 [Aphelenchoides besseyi]|nr:hypothetical protein M3Y98_00837100 [Aphelenchoides besseyi]KAI6195475.1 hypothetical protein M3Y96_01235300 [Aphelenchoides besseyi]
MGEVPNSNICAHRPTGHGAVSTRDSIAINNLTAKVPTAPKNGTTMPQIVIPKDSVLATGMKLKSSKPVQMATESKKKRKPKNHPKTQVEETDEFDDNENHEIVKSMPLNGWNRFVHEYNSSFHHIDELRARCLQVIEAHQEQLAELRAKGKSHRNEADDNGWITVTNRKRVAKRKQHEQPKSKLLKLAEEARIRHRRPVTLV